MTPNRLRKLAFGLLWAGFAAYAFLLAPPDRPDTFDLIARLSSGDWDGLNPILVALFNLMGVWPLVYGCLLFADGRDQPDIAAWPFAAGTFGIGAFSLLPYLALREPNPRFSGPRGGFLRLWDSRWTGAVLAIAAIALVAYGLQGDLPSHWADFAQQWRTSRFIHVMSLDFCLLCLLFPALAGDDAARRGWPPETRPRWVPAIAWVPLFGALAYLCLRPGLPDGERAAESASVADAGTEGTARPAESGS